MDIDKLSKPYFLIHPDYEGCLGTYSLDYCCYGCDDDTIELEGYEHTPFVIPGIESWCWEWDRESWKAIHGVQSMFDWNDWHNRGLHLAQQLRQLMPDEIEIVYRRGEEDILLEKIKYFAFSPDTCFMVGDTNVGSEFYDGDYLEIGYFKSFILEGLDKWWREFDSHVEYADTWADPDFDWMSWYVRGLELVKIIRANLHESIEVWYRIPYELHQTLPIPDLLVKKDGTFLIRDFLSHKP